MSTLHLTVGLPGSGKSTSSEEYESNLDNVTVLSSDALREELYGDVDNQDNNEEVFEELYKRAEHNLSNGVDVILDSTNISAKRRMAVIERFRGKATKLVAHYYSTPYDTCVMRNNMRDRSVPYHVIKNMFKGLHIPLTEEGWDDVRITHAFGATLTLDRSYVEQLISNDCDHQKLFNILKTYLEEISAIYDLPHDSSYHSLSVSRHTYYVWQYILNNYHEKDKLVMLWAAILHDVGKAFCKEFKKLDDGTYNRYANFIGHEHVSAQLVVYELHKFGYDDNFIFDVVRIVQNHMRLLQIGDSQKAINKLRNFVGEDLLQKLEFFRHADTSAK